MEIFEEINEPVTEIGAQDRSTKMKNHTLQQKQVLSFINSFCSDAGQRISACDPRDVIDGISSFYRAGWCYYFATILKTAFGRGKVCWMAPFSHVAWEDTDGTVYDVEGIYVGEAFYAIPEEYCGLHMLGFLHSPAYPEKNHYSSKEELIGIVKSYCEISGETYDNKIENWFKEE